MSRQQDLIEEEVNRLLTPEFMMTSKSDKQGITIEIETANGKDKKS